MVAYGSRAAGSVAFAAGLLASSAGARAGSLSGRRLVITATEQSSGPGLIPTTPLSGLRPDLFVAVAKHFQDKSGADAHCVALKASDLSGSARQSPLQ